MDNKFYDEKQVLLRDWSSIMRREFDYEKEVL